MHAGQRETCDAVIEGGQIGPGNRVVAIRTVRSGKRGTRGGVHGVIRFVPIGQVAGGVAAISRSRCQVVVVIYVALGAGNGCVGVR